MHQVIEIRPSLPQPIGRLEELARNLWYSWNADARSLFYRLDRDLWRRVGHNPILFLRQISQKRLLAAAKDRTYLEHYNRIMAAFDVYASDSHTWYSTECDSSSADGVIAYFSAEFGVHESLPIFSGGLGVLAGDHLKSASDLGLPFVAVGLLYRKGYFIQHIDTEGRQMDVYEEHDFTEMPVSVVYGADGQPVVVDVDLEDRVVQVKVWEARVGRNPLYLLDADIPQNQMHDRLITHQLYGGDMEMRICQEIVLGMGGVRALAALGIEPACWHMNEGHSVFLGLERIHHLMKHRAVSFYEALEVVRATTVFTTHTPVAAGHDAFPMTLMDKYFDRYWQGVGLTRGAFLELGRELMPEGHEVFSLTVLALNLSGWVNGVSRLHGKVSSDMWKDIWPGVPPDENPISHVTNGVHSLSWLAPEMMDLFDQHLGVEWRANICNPEFWEAVDHIPDALLWGAHQNLKRRMIERIRERTIAQRIRNGEGAAAIRQAGTLLDPELLTIGFARRFTTYKRATLLFNDLERLERIVTDPERPVQLVFAGKAHPADTPGQELMRRIHDVSRMPAFAGRIVLVEGYDISIARYLVSGVDVWLNTPRRPYEASGTSGMKVAMNGGVNFSVLDGWWCEAARDGVNGWNIGDARDVGDEERLSGQDALTLYETLEGAIASLYYERNAQGIPDKWVQVSKASMRTIPPVFNTDRMVSEYSRRFYFPAITKGRRLAAENHAMARDMAGWKAFMRRHWPEVSVRWGTDGGEPRTVTFGDEVSVGAQVRLGPIPPADVLVEAYVLETGPAAREGALRIPLQPAGDAVDGFVPYRSAFVPPDSGRFTATVRVSPYHPELIHPYEIGLIRWLGIDSRAAEASGKRMGRVTATATAVPAGKEADGGSPRA